MQDDPLVTFGAADPPYQHALEELAALRYARDQALLDASGAGLEEEALSAGTGLELHEVRAALVRARGADAGEEESGSGQPSTITLTALYEPAERGWVSARVAEFPAVITCGRDRVEARALLLDALREWLLSLQARPEQAVADAKAEREPLELALSSGGGEPR